MIDLETHLNASKYLLQTVNLLCFKLNLSKVTSVGNF